jgi:hypothetical protein
MVGSPGLVDVAIAAGTIPAYPSSLCAEDQQKYDAEIHAAFRSTASARNRTCLCEVRSAEVCFALFKKKRVRLSMLSNNKRAVSLVCLAASFLLSGCDQSINTTVKRETELTGMYCDAKGDQESNCKVGDVIATVAGRAGVLCDWGWEIVRQSGGDEVLCILRGAPREVRPPIAAGPEK